MPREELLDLVWREFHAEAVEALSLRSASRLIDRLKQIPDRRKSA